MIQRVWIYVAILLGLVGVGKWSYAAGQETLNAVAKKSTGDAVTQIREGFNTELAKQQRMNTELYAADLLKANTSAFASQSAFTTAWGWTPGGVSAWSDVQALISGSGDYIKYDGTRGTPPGSSYTPGTDISISGGVISLSWDKDYADLVNTPTMSPLTASMVTGVFSGTGDCLGSNGEKVACGSGGAFAFDTFPTYSDSPHTSGIAVNDTHIAVYSGATNGWGKAALTFDLNPTPIVPTLTSRVIGTDGTTLTLTGSASLSVGAGGSGGFDLDCSVAGNDIALSNPQGFPGTSVTYTIAETIAREADGESCNLDYTQPGNGIEATTGGADLASITSAAVTNNSNQIAPTQIGYTSIGVSTASGTSRAISFVATSSGSVSTAHVYLGGPGTGVAVGIFNDSNGSPGTKLAQTASITRTADVSAWSAAALDSAVSIVAGTRYWAIYISNGNSTYYYNDDAGVDNASSIGFTYPTITSPATFTTSSLHRKASIYFD